MENKAQQTKKEKFKLLEEIPINIKKIKKEKRIRKNKGTNASFLEKKRTADEIRTNDNSSKNKHSSESDSQSTQIKKGIKVIYFKSSKYINQSKLEKIFSKYGKIEEIKITKEDQGFIKFSRSEFAQNAMNDKNIIYEKNKLTIDFKKIEIQKDVEIKEEEEEEEKDKSIKKEKEEDNSKKDKAEDNNENEEKDSENERETSFIKTKIQKRNEKSKDKDYSEGFGQKIQTLEDVISAIKRYYKEMEDYKKQNDEYKKQNDEYKKKNDEYKKQNDEYKKQNDEYKKQNEEYKKKNEKDKKNLFKLIGVLGEINYQNEKYITYLNLKIENLNDKIEIILNSYKILYILKLANILLNELYKKHSDKIVNKSFGKKKKDHNVTICLSSIEGIDCDRVNLIIDFLKHTKIRASSFIHLEDKEIKFQREILYVYLSPASNDEEKEEKEEKHNFSLNEFMSLIFQKSEKKNEVEVVGEKGNEFYKKIKKFIKKEIEENGKEENKEINNKGEEEETEKDEDEDEEERIKKILKGDEDVIDTNLNSQLNFLLKKIKLNSKIVNPETKKFKKIDGEFFYNSWIDSFSNVEIKSDPIYTQYVKIDERTTLEKMGSDLKTLLKGIKIDFFSEDLSRIELQLKQIN